MSFACVLHFAMSSSACFSKLASVRVPLVLSVVRSEHRHTHMHPSPPQTLFSEPQKNVLRMGRDLTSGLGISPVDRLSNFVPFGGRLMPQRLTG